MMGDDTEPEPAKRHQLAAELRRSRELAGLSGRDLAQRIGISQSKVSRIESGATVPSLPEVTAWARAVQAPADRRQLLMALTEMAYTEVQSYRQALQARTHIQDEIEERELRARRVCTFQPSVVPGLLQTAEYARRIFSMAAPAYAVDDIAAVLSARLRRQLALYEEDKQFEFVITEAALRWRPGPVKLLLAQLDRISSLATLDNVSIGLIPLRGQAISPVSHGFVIYHVDDGDWDAFVEVETIHANLIVNDPDNVGLYQQRWTQLAKMAVFDDDARTLLTERAAEVRTTEV
jgi:transcriptional regulator with XRE-family HTH domain